ncbi:ribosomal protein S15, mitochondrial precursor, putative [Plasmodium knowlesi strain H]|uniref:Ribosomal protein S15, mitochondrial, putative n=3 Tax=Plasmodium knowlesi TaxID=5850 RepID=A0A5K1UBM8_PLAKH|nr:ribosomal protein S15, mitochondrial, putative [Plasmodium knowlesi strain H]OTN63667.1 putative Ribosomal protein S15 - mitochondrial [Plasmodium knowlesi]CAA9990712.1 ribosomal protein S15, mitochondrial, putative [Plasmodium knowlesi strain H]SBO25882.1 ribosomal protein S15, mitochondrial precursor, putative [Plasmodium knowlesi strain H]SBO28645.1 ribosomal protein S15, mitochondrial precursor, putative [Plasmodium knowlesi strain H]VVS80186.1 ribosomal protein S15, mitochondrial, puta|eukprot:XP_002262002.1 ribosomal protein S15, mitochondrial precursor,putative [Plasmodium knowlesi strain H]
MNIFSRVLKQNKLHVLTPKDHHVPFIRCAKRYESRVKAHRYTGITAIKTHAQKTEWYLKAERDFLAERNQIPNGFIGLWQYDDIKHLRKNIINMLHLNCANNKQLHKYKKLCIRRCLQRRPFDTGSAPVQIGCLTEKILNLRAHLILRCKDHPKKRTMSIWLARRQKLMKYLYKTDFELYKHTCNLLKIKCILFAIPDSRDRSKAINAAAVDGDRCKFLIRQKLWKGKYRPRPMKDPKGQTIRYTRHPIEQPPSDYALPKEYKPQISNSWPYGVKENYQKGTYTVYNPTAPGLGYCPVPMLF